MAEFYSDRSGSVLTFWNVHYRKGNIVVTVGLLVRLEARPGSEEEVARRLTSAVAVVNNEAGTPVWLGVRFGSTAFGVFDAFADDAARQAHLSAHLGALEATAAELCVAAPTVEPVDVLAAKLPGQHL
jgi:quinol monooxygenase YgiN